MAAPWGCARLSLKWGGIGGNEETRGQEEDACKPLDVHVQVRHRQLRQGVARSALQHFDDLADNWLRPVVGIEDGTSDMVAQVIAGSSTGLGFLAVQSAQNLTLPKGKNWIDPP